MFTIRRAITGSFAAIILVFVVATGLIWWQQGVMEKAFDFVERVKEADAHLLECRRQEKNFLLRRDSASIAGFQASHEQLTDTLRRLVEEVGTETFAEPLRRLAEESENYGRLVVRLTEGSTGAQREADDEARLVEEIVVSAGKGHAHVADAGREVAVLFERAGCRTRTIGLVGVLSGVALALLVGWWLTRATARPLEELRDVADQMSGGDIRDAHITFSDLELSRGATREARALAEAMTRMVRSLRYIVSSEQGMMDDYHMTILLLVNRAVGPAGRWAIERARMAAGFGSFADVGLSDLDRFLPSLQKEVAMLIPHEQAARLCEAIQRLAG